MSSAAGSSSKIKLKNENSPWDLARWNSRYERGLFSRVVQEKTEMAKEIMRIIKSSRNLKL